MGCWSGEIQIEENLAAILNTRNGTIVGNLRKNNTTNHKALAVRNNDDCLFFQDESNL